MFETVRFISQDGFHCPECGGEGSIHKTVRFDEDGNSVLLAMELVCNDCDESFEITESNSEFIVMILPSLEE